MRPGLRIAARWIAAAAGLYLLIRLIQAIGPGEIANALQSHWLFLLTLTVVYTSYHALRTWTLQICIPGRSRFGHVFGIRLAGEAVAYLAIGSVLGDTLKVALGRDRIPVVESATGVFAEKLIYHLSGAAFIIGGLLAAICRFGASPLLLYSIAGFLLLFLAVLYLMSSGVRPLERILRRSPVRNPRVREAVLRTEESLFRFRKDHPRAFVLALILDFVSYFYSIAEVYAALHLLGAQPAFLDLWYFQAVVKAMNAGMMIIPANIGVFEATNIYLARQLEYGQEAGMIAALFIRIRATLWSGIGYAWFLGLLRSPRRGGSQQH